MDTLAYGWPIVSHRGARAKPGRRRDRALGLPAREGQLADGPARLQAPVRFAQVGGIDRPEHLGQRGAQFPGIDQAAGAAEDAVLLAHVRGAEAARVNIISQWMPMHLAL